MNKPGIDRARQIEDSPAGDRRNRPVQCQRGCGRQTWNFSGMCWDCHPLRGLPGEDGRPRPEHEAEAD